MRFESYAQEFEDLILYVALEDIKNIFYIDVGANDPTSLSVTRYFYQSGGCGINIEPLRDKCKLLEQERSRDINLCVGIGNQMGRLPLFTMGTGSSFSDKVAQSNNCNSGHMKTILTLSNVYEWYCSPKQQIHFCKIDVEGFEKQVLEGIKDWNTFRPWIFVVEAAKPGTSIPCYDEWEHILRNNGYVLAYSTKINRFYIDERREWLLDRFKNVDEFVNNNEIVKMEMNIVYSL